MKGIIRKPTQNRLGLRIGFSKFDNNEICIQNNFDDSENYTQNVYVTIDEIPILIRELEELKKRLGD